MKKQTRKVLLDLSDKDHYKLSLMAVKSRISLKKFIENIVEDYLNQKPK